MYIGAAAIAIERTIGALLIGSSPTAKKWVSIGLVALQVRQTTNTSLMNILKMQNVHVENVYSKLCEHAPQILKNMFGFKLLVHINNCNLIKYFIKPA